jgi:hypothetical protein
MDGMKPPQLTEQPVQAVRPEHLARLLKGRRPLGLPIGRKTAQALDRYLRHGTRID